MANNNLTPEQQELLNQLADYGKHLQERAYSSYGKYVAAGYAGDSTETGKLYCYCGHGNGYKGAPLIPANAAAILFSTKAAAEAKASLLHYSNARGERITLKAMPASEYFWLLFDDTCKTMQLAEQMAVDMADQLKEFK